MSNNLPKTKKLINKQNANYLSSKNSKITKRANSQKKYLNSPDIITQLPNPNLYSNNFYSNKANNLNGNLNLLHQQAFTPINRRNKLYEEELLLPQKSPKFEGKKTLVLDIDETLVHSSFFPFEKNDLVLNVNFDGIFYNIYVLVRPGAEQFIKNISKFFEIITFTASIQAYASPLLDILDKDRKIQHRLYREHCTFVNGVFIKDLKRLNRNLKDLIIVDNSPLAFALDTDNGLPILSWFDDPIDRELTNIQPLLEFLASTKDVRKYIKKFVKNNNINYEIAHKIIKENTDNKKIKIKKENINQIENNEKNNICIVENNNKDKNNKGNNNKDNNNNKDKEITNNINEKDEEKNSLNNNINKNQIKGKLLNNFITNNDNTNNPVLVNDNLKNNSISVKSNNNKTNNGKNPSDNINLDLLNKPNNNKLSEYPKKNLRSKNLSKNNNKSSNKNIIKKNNIFRLEIKINDNNIISINNNLNHQIKFNNKMNSNLENDYKINDNVLMPIIFSSPPNTSKNKNYHILYENLKNKNEKINIDNPKEKFLKNKNSSNINNIKSVSLKEALEDKYNSVRQFKYINLIEKFQDNKIKSSSLKLLNKNKEDLKFKNNFNGNNAENSHRSGKYKLKTTKNDLNIRNQIRISSKPKISNIINKGFAINNVVNKGKINDIYNKALRSRSTGNFIKLKSTQISTPKKNINQFMDHKIKLFKEEENKIYLRNNSYNKKIEILSISGYSPKNLKLAS